MPFLGYHFAFRLKFPSFKLFSLSNVQDWPRHPWLNVLRLIISKHGSSQQFSCLVSPCKITFIRTVLSSQGRDHPAPGFIAPHENRKNLHHFIKPRDHGLLPWLLYLERGVNDPYSIWSTLPLLRYIHDGDRVDSFSQLTHTPCASTVWFTSGSSNCPHQDCEGQWLFRIQDSMTAT